MFQPANDVPPPPPPLDEVNPAIDTGSLASHAQTVAKFAAERKLSALSHSSNSSFHAFSEAEKTAFVKHINTVLENDSDLMDKLPIDPASNDIFEQVRDGVLLCKLINASVPDTIDAGKVIKQFRDDKAKIHHVIVNQNLCIEGAKKIGAVVVNMGAEDLAEGKPYLVFGLLWQIIKIGLLQEVDVGKHPELAGLKEGEEDLANLPPEELLLKWFNWHLKRAGTEEFVANFSSLTDSTAYIHLMHRLAPEACSLEALNEPDSLKRAEIMLMDAEKLGCRSFVTPSDIVEGNEKLNLVFAANLFNKSIGMGSMSEQMEQENTSLHQKKKALEDEVESLKKQVESLKAENQRSSVEMAGCTKKIADFDMQVLHLKAEREELARKITKLYESNDQLVAHIRNMDEAKTAVEKAYQDLLNENDGVKSELAVAAEELQRERISLETSEFCGASLANDLEGLRSRQEKLEYLLDHLKLERIKSDMHVERLRILYNSFQTTESLCEAIYEDVTLQGISEGASKCGYLTKKARNGSSWKYRFFVLRDNFLFYFKSDKDPKAKFSGVIRVDDAVIKVAENPTKRDLKDQWLLAIEVPNNNDSIENAAFYIAGEDAELEGWQTQTRIAARFWTKGNRRLTSS